MNLQEMFERANDLINIRCSQEEIEFYGRFLRPAIANDILNDAFSMEIVKDFQDEIPCVVEVFDMCHVEYVRG